MKTETAGQAVMEESITAAGRVELQPQGRNEVRAWYPGRVMEMTKVIGQRVQKGEIVARVESSSSLQTYADPGADGRRDHGAATRTSATWPATRRST